LPWNTGMVGCIGFCRIGICRSSHLGLDSLVLTQLIIFDIVQSPFWLWFIMPQYTNKYDIRVT
jgi:hypothetical protein